MAGKKQAGKAKKKEETAFSKEALIKSQKYQDRCDVLNAMLESGRFYTVSEVDAMIKSFMKGKVK